MRKLATIRKIENLLPIEGADAIECAVIGGWKVVVKKGEYQVGDFAIYCEIDSWIPHELAPFLSKGQEPREFNGVKGERLRTVKLRGTISQGLLLPINNVLGASMIKDMNGETHLVNEEDDVSELLGIQKWEAPIPAQLAGDIDGPFPSEVPKTDEERIQNLSDEWNVLKTYTYEVTEKLEGSSMTVGLVQGKFVVCSRNWSLRSSESNTMWRMAMLLDIENKLRALGLDNIAIQGELIGEGIQGNYYKIQGHRFYVFSVYDADQGLYLDPAARSAISTKLDLNHVPVIDSAMSVADSSIASLLDLADGKSQLNSAVNREGLVFKRVDGPEHFKAISNRYLLKNSG